MAGREVLHRSRSAGPRPCRVPAYGATMTAVLDPALTAIDVPTRGLRRVEFDALVEHGFFADERVELLGGQLVEMPPPSPIHVWVLERLFWLLSDALRGRYRVGQQMPIALDDISEPLPDVLVTDPITRDAHPERAYFLGEVAVSSLAYDLRAKAPRYAAAGIPAYWVIDVGAREVVVHTGPSPTGYREVRRVGRDTTLTVLGIDIDLAELLPGPDDDISEG